MGHHFLTECAHIWIVMHRDGLPALRRLPILVLTGPGVSRKRNFVDQNQCVSTKPNCQLLNSARSRVLVLGSAYVQNGTTGKWRNFCHLLFLAPNANPNPNLTLNLALCLTLTLMWNNILIIAPLKVKTSRSDNRHRHGSPVPSFYLQWMNRQHQHSCHLANGCRYITSLKYYITLQWLQ